jgi:hypothetical protein
VEGGGDLGCNVVEGTKKTLMRTPCHVLSTLSVWLRDVYRPVLVRSPCERFLLLPRVQPLNDVASFFAHTTPPPWFLELLLLLPHPRISSVEVQSWRAAAFGVEACDSSPSLFKSTCCFFIPVKRPGGAAHPARVKGEQFCVVGTSFADTECRPLGLCTFCLRSPTIFAPPPTAR